MKIFHGNETVLGANHRDSFSSDDNVFMANSQHVTTAAIVANEINENAPPPPPPPPPMIVPITPTSTRPSSRTNTACKIS